jgi:hypothetical protein
MDSWHSSRLSPAAGRETCEAAQRICRATQVFAGVSTRHLGLQPGWFSERVMAKRFNASTSPPPPNSVHLRLLHR